MYKINKLLEEFDLEDFQGLNQTLKSSDYDPDYYSMIGDTESNAEQPLYPSIKNILRVPEPITQHGNWEKNQQDFFQRDLNLPVDNTRPGGVGPYVGGRGNWEKNQQDFFQRDLNLPVDNTRPGGIKPMFVSPEAPEPSEPPENLAISEIPNSSSGLKKALAAAGGLGGIGLLAHYNDNKNKEK